jgi:transposase
VRHVVKLKERQALLCPPAPPAGFEKRFAEVRVLAGLRSDKFRYHLPLYRQHQRLLHAGSRLSRATLTQWGQRTAALLEPLYYARLSAILQRQVLTRDEAPSKAGRRGKGTLHTGSCWPVYGDQEEVAFPFAASRAGSVVREAGGSFCGVLVTAGYLVYQRFAQTVNRLVHAQCWSHARRQFVAAERVEPALVAQALDRIGALSEHEAVRRQRGLEAEAKLAYRAEYAKPLGAAVFAGLKQTRTTQVLLPSTPFTHAAHYALEREQALRVLLAYPNVPLDTNHLEREIRALALGRRTWLFCWTAVGAQSVGIVQSLIASCRLQGIAPYGYFVEVLPRIATHPTFEVHLLTPRLWKQHFADNPLRSDLDRLRQ